MGGAASLAVNLCRVMALPAEWMPPGDILTINRYKWYLESGAAPQTFATCALNGISGECFRGLYK